MTYKKGKKRIPKPEDFKPVKDFPKDHKFYGKPRCQAWNGNQGRQCMALAMVRYSKDKCRVHGGKSPAGMDSPSFKTGKHSKYLAIRHLGAYEEFRNNPEKLNQQDEIALVDTRIADLMGRIDSAEAGIWWKRARKAYDDLMVQMRKGNNEAVAACLNDLNRFIGAGSQDYAVWDEIIRLVDQRRRLVESERRRLVEMQQMITSQEAWVLISALMESVNENVSDPAIRARVNSDFIRNTERTHQHILVGESNGN